MVKKGQCSGPAGRHKADGAARVWSLSPVPALPPPALHWAIPWGLGSERTTEDRARAPETHLHVVTLLLLHLGVDTQLFPGAQHTYPRPGRRENHGVQEPESNSPSAIQQPRCGLCGAHGEHGETWLTCALRQPEGVAAAGMDPLLGTQFLCRMAQCEQGDEAGETGRWEGTLELLWRPRQLHTPYTGGWHRTPGLLQLCRAPT